MNSQRRRLVDMSNVHFIDTSVLVELLNIPMMNEHHAQTKAEYERLANNGDVFVLPIAVLVETGNHIAHISDGNLRYTIAGHFSSLIQQAVESQNNWNTAPGITEKILKSIIKYFPEKARQRIGLGDVSIVEQFEDYWKHQQPIGEMRIWSLDGHLQGYSRSGGLSRRKDK